MSFMSCVTCCDLPKNIFVFIDINFDRERGVLQNSCKDLTTCSSFLNISTMLPVLVLLKMRSILYPDDFNFCHVNVVVCVPPGSL